MAGASLAVGLGTPAACAVPPAPAPAGAPERDLHALAEALLPSPVLEAMVRQGVDVVLRTKWEKDPEWQALERQFPGLSDAALNATRQAAMAGVPGMIATLQADATAFFSARLTAGERAAFAAYLRRPYPQRMAHMAVDARPGETVLEAVKRAVKTAESSATAEDLRQEQQFYASPLGQKCAALTSEYTQRSSARQAEIVTPILKAALAKGSEAGAAFVAAHRPR
jgi:hypothetical protein